MVVFALQPFDIPTFEVTVGPPCSVGPLVLPVEEQEKPLQVEEEESRFKVKLAPV